MHTGGGGGERGRGGIKVYPPSKIFAKLVNKNAIKHQKGVPSPQIFHNPYIPSLPKFGKNLTDPPPGFSNRVHLCSKVKIHYNQKYLVLIIKHLLNSLPPPPQFE
jgi:hypothetical protein